MIKAHSQTGKRMLSTFCIPVGTLIIFWLICSLRGSALFETQGHIVTFIRSTVVICFTSWALSLNLNSGRFDFSIGSIALLSSMLGAKAALALNLPAFGMLIASILCGAILGVLSGLLYVLLRLPPIITSLGVTLICEAGSFLVTKGEGVLISTNLNLLQVASLPWLIVILAIGLAGMVFLFNFTVFGYNQRALQHGQKIAVNTGIGEVLNAVICYGLAGLLMGVVGCVNIATRGSASVALNFSSISTMFVAFLPLFLGGFIGRFSEDRFGIFLGSVTSALITLGFVRLEISGQMQSLINAVILVCFLIYLNNEGMLRQKISLHFGKRAANEV